MITQEEMDFIKQLLKEKSKELNTYLSITCSLNISCACEFDLDSVDDDAICVDKEYTFYSDTAGFKYFQSIDEMLMHIKSLKKNKESIKISIDLQQKQISENCIVHEND